MADSELMTLELKAMIRKIETFRTSLPDKLRIMQRFYDAVFEAGTRAGEIARSEFVIDLLGKRIARILEVGRAENDGEDYGQSHCFHLMEIQRILRGERTCGVYDDYGALPLSGAEESKKRRHPQRKELL